MLIAGNGPNGILAHIPEASHERHMHSVDEVGSLIEPWLGEIPN